MDLREFYLTHYFHETDRRDQINNSLTIPLGVISLVCGAFLVISKEIDYPFDYSEIFQLCFLVLTALSLISAAVFLGRAYWGYGYAHMPRTEEIRQYHDGLINHYVNLHHNVEDAIKLAQEETLQYVDSQYSVNAEQNAENNDRKSANLFKANGFTMSSVVFLVISAVPYVIDTIVKTSEVQKVEISNLMELSMPNHNSQPPIPQSQQQPAPPPPKPAPPPSRVIREHVEPPAKR